MPLHRYERWWIWIGIATMLSLFVILVALEYLQGFTPPSHVASINPATLTQTPPFNRPGLRRMPDGTYQAYYVGQVFFWTPQRIVVPRGATVRFFVTSTDVVHGFEIAQTDVNIEVIPGWVSTSTQTFTHSGSYLIVCNQYCGIGHQDMYAKVIVQ